MHGGKKRKREKAVHNNTGPDRCLGRGAPRNDPPMSARNDPPITRAVAQAIQNMQQTCPYTTVLCLVYIGVDN